MTTKLIKNFLITLVLIFIGLFSANFLNFAHNQVKAEKIPSIPGRTEGTGTHFEIKDSEYLNIILESTKEITLVLESIPKTLSLDVSSSIESTSTKLTIGGLESNKTYYKYQDNYENETFFFSSGGNYTYAQDITQSHHIWIEEKTEPPFLSNKLSDSEEAFDTPILNDTSSQILNEASFSENPIELFTIPNEVKITFMVAKELTQPKTEFQIGEDVDF